MFVQVSSSSGDKFRASKGQVDSVMNAVKSSVRCVDASCIWLTWNLRVDQSASMKSYRQSPIFFATDPPFQSLDRRYRTQTGSAPSMFRATAPCRSLNCRFIFRSLPVFCFVGRCVIRGLRPKKSPGEQCCCGRDDFGVVL